MTDNSDGIGDELVIDRSHIRCDCCGKPGPTKSCSRCMSYYYCNRECQLNHWKKNNHKDSCLFLKGMRERYMEEKRKEREIQEDRAKGKTYDAVGECAICLEEIELPIILECGHVFCVKCLVLYQTKNLSKGSCPNCRGDIRKGIGSEAGEQLMVYAERAKLSHGAEREMYIDLALRHIDDTTSFDSIKLSKHQKDHVQLGKLYSKLTVFRHLDMHRKVIETADEFMNLCATTDHDVSAKMIFQSRMIIAKSHRDLKEWQSALDMFELVYDDCKVQNNVGQGSAVVAEMSRVHYELQNYNKVIIEGDRATYLDNRVREGVHKYIALSQMKLGDIAAAKKTITRGILYEEQWNEDIKKENEEVLRMILAEEAQQNPKSKSKKKGKKKGRGKK